MFGFFVWKLSVWDLPFWILCSGFVVRDFVFGGCGFGSVFGPFILIVCSDDYVWEFLFGLFFVWDCLCCVCVLFFCWVWDLFIGILCLGFVVWDCLFGCCLFGIMCLGFLCGMLCLGLFVCL